MPAITTLLALGAAGLGTAAQVSGQKRAQRDAERNARMQEIHAQNAAKLKGPSRQDVKVKLGSTGVSAAATQTSSNNKGTASADTGATKRVGKVFAHSTSASSVGGL